MRRFLDEYPLLSMLEVDIVFTARLLSLKRGSVDHFGNDISGVGARACDRMFRLPCCRISWKSSDILFDACCLGVVQVVYRRFLCGVQVVYR